MTDPRYPTVTNLGRNPEPAADYVFVTAPLGAGAHVGYADFTNLTPVPVKDIRFHGSGQLRVTFDTTTPFNAQLRRAIRRRIMATSTDNETVRATITATQTVIDSWAANADLDVAVLADRVRLLSTQVTALARLLDP